MREVTTRQFQKQAGIEIKKGLPIALMNYGKVVAYVTDQNPEKDSKIIQEDTREIKHVVGDLANMVTALKYQTYPQRKPLKLIICKTHHVFTATCGCDREKGGEK